MPFRFLQIPARGCEQAESEMNLFLQSHRVLTVDRRLVDAELSSDLFKFQLFSVS